jgi:hypothetical protein
MKRLLWISTLIITGESCIRNPKVLPELLFDTSRIAIIAFSDTLNSKDKPTNLKQAELSEIENIFLKSIADYNSVQNARGIKRNYIDDKRYHYKRQYVCYLNEKGQKIVYVNCFCHDYSSDWHKSIIIVKDGGECYFHLKINLTTKKYFEFMVNGEA